MKKKISLDDRVNNCMEHDPRSEAIYRGIAKIDFEECGDYFCFKDGGDGDNGEVLMYLLDIYFERDECQQNS